jgi:hypothetical protein
VQGEDVSDWGPAAGEPGAVREASRDGEPVVMLLLVQRMQLPAGVRRGAVAAAGGGGTLSRAEHHPATGNQWRCCAADATSSWSTGEERSPLPAADGAVELGKR